MHTTLTLTILIKLSYVNMVSSLAVTLTMLLNPLLRKYMQCNKKWWLGVAYYGHTKAQ